LYPKISMCSAGFYTESNPQDLAPGASPCAVNTTFIIGSVDIRPGLQSNFYYLDFFVEKIAGFAHSVAGSHAPNEGVWLNPSRVTVGTPGSYASVSLNSPAFAANGYWDSLGSATASGDNHQFVMNTNSAIANETAIFLSSTAATFPSGPVPQGAGWLNQTGNVIGLDGNYQRVYTEVIAASGALATTVIIHPSAIKSYGAIIGLFNSNGISPTFRQSVEIASGTINSGTYPGTIPTVLQGSAIFVMLSCANGVGNGLWTNVTATDNQGNQYFPIGIAGDNSDGTGDVVMLMAPNVSAGTINVSVVVTGGAGSTGAGIDLVEVTGLVPFPGSTASISQRLECLNFPFAIPLNVGVFGLQVELSGNQSSLVSDAFLSVNIVDGSGNVSNTVTTQLPSSDGTIVLGGPMENWGFTLTPAFLNNPNLTVRIVAQATTQLTFNLFAVKLKANISPNPPPSINYLKTFGETDGQINNLFLGSNGIMYQEDPINAEFALAAVYTAIEPNSFAQSCTQSDREFIAISDLIQGTDIPYTYNDTNFDRCSQVGPGAPPVCSTSAVTQNIVSITQFPPQSDPEAPGQLSGLLWSSGPGSTSPGNIVTVYYARTAALANPDPNLQPGVGVALAGLGGVNSIPQLANGVYTVASIGQGIPPGAQFARWYFTIQQTTSLFNNQADHIEGHGPFGTYQVTTATMTTAAQVPNLQVGNQFQITGTGGAPTAGYDGTWTVLTTPNASQLTITSTALSGNLATYSFVLVTGTTPAVGQFVTVTNTLNGNGIFNITNVAIQSASPGSFTVQLFGADVPSSAENGAGIIAGTIFTFDPMAIVGTKNTGSIVTTGIIGQGIRKCCYSYLTRNGYMTQPSPITTFDVPSGASTITVSNLLTGPPNVIARVIHLTAANGGNFYNIPEPVPVLSNGVTITNTATWVNDNTSTSATLSFSDVVLLAATQIDAQGNNLFETAELGSSLGFVPYASRIFAIGEQNKITNFLNWSFDGGILGGSGSSATYPAGWTVDPVLGSGVSVINSPIFGFAYSVTNSSGSTQSTYGMIYQSAFQDEFQVPIIQASTTYSVRVTAALPSGASTGQFVVDLFSPAIGMASGTFTLQFAQLTSTMQIFTGTLLTTSLAPVPNDLRLRIYTTNIQNGAQFTADRVEVFPTKQPNLATQVTGSYINNFEAFDQVTGVISGAVQNQQPIRSAFVLFDVLYLVKTKSFLAIRNVDGLEPVFWGTPRVVSNSVGTPSIYGVTSGIDTPNSGEEWSIIAGEAGAFIFNGGEPMKLSEEITTLWNQINWAYGHTLWVQNDIVNRRILFGVPLKTVDEDGEFFDWLPEGFIAADPAPTKPNVVLELNYKMLGSASALMNSVGVRPTYSGKLIHTDYTRKWSVWTMSIPAAAFISRGTQDSPTAPIMLGNSANNGKIYQLVKGFMQDDGVAIHQSYVTYAFPSTDQEGALQIGPTRKTFEMMLAILDGTGSCSITAYPNTLDTPFATPLLPDIPLPSSNNGDVEIPVNVVANRCLFRFDSNAVDSGFELSRINLAMTKDPWSPVRGLN
jgi:hypothetical protein